MKIVFGKNKVKFAAGVLLIALMFTCALQNQSSIRTIIVLGCCTAFVGSLQIETERKEVLTWIYGATFLAIPAITFYIGQIMQNISLLSVPPVCVLLNIVIILILQLITLIISNNLRLSMTIGCVVPTLMVLINTYVYMFRGNALTPSDLLSARTAAKVVADYNLLPTAPMLYALMMAGILILAVWSLPRMQTKRNHLRHGIAVTVCAAALLCAGSQREAHHWENDGSQYNGYLLNFLLQVKAVFVTEPDGYGPDAIKKLEAQYAQTDEAGNSSPDIIVIMNESFADLNVFGSNLSTNIDVTPFIDSLQENTIRGYLYASVFGGSTANSEYEFLSGNSMAFFPRGSIVYQQFIRENPYSLLSVLKNAGYDCVAMHPYHEEGWMRNEVYPILGFDELYFLDDFPRDQLLREYVSDQGMFGYIIDYHEQHDKNAPLFLFGITMQNHGGYTYDGSNNEPEVTLEGYSEEFPEAEQYLNLIHETDKAVQYLIEYYTFVDRDVMIVFFGDHMPKIEDAFYETLNRGPFDALDEQMCKQMVPFFIWANYEIEEPTVLCSSINYLPVYLLETAGISLPPYFRFLKQTEAVIPAINAFGYYSLNRGCFLPLDEAEGAEAELIRSYRILQYNNVFDEKNHSELFFEP